MYMGRRGIGQTDCGTNPCWWWDNVWASDACLSYLGCADPTNPLYLTVTKGLIVGGSQVAGSAVGESVTGFLTAAAAPTGVPVWAWLAGLGLVGLMVLPKLVK